MSTLFVFFPGNDGDPLSIHFHQSTSGIYGGVPKMVVPNNHWFSHYKINDHFWGVLGAPPFNNKRFHLLFVDCCPLEFSDVVKWSMLQRNLQYGFKVI